MWIARLFKGWTDEDVWLMNRKKEEEEKEDAEKDQREAALHKQAQADKERADA